MINHINNPDPLIQATPEQQQELASIKAHFISLAMKLMDTNQPPIDLLEIYPETSSLEELYEQLTDLKKCLDSFRPFNAAQMKNLQEVFDTEYTYASNRIEGNTLTLRETSFVINEGLTIRNKSMKDHLEAINHKEAIEFIRELVTNQEPLTERNIKLIHSLILQGIDRQNAGAYRGVVVGIRGTDIVFPEPYLVPKMMEDLLIFYEENKEELHPVQLAAQMHSKLVNIHPFIDGNGRTCRLVMNLILLQHGYPLTIFSPEEEDRSRYFDSLNQARDMADESPFERFVAENVKHWIIEYLGLLAPNMGQEDESKGYYFFKKVEPYLNK
jgi:Fic family protein